jgi:hypothetical protein
MEKMHYFLKGLLLLCLCWSCKTETHNPVTGSPLTGVWFHEHSTKHKGTVYTSRLEYHFYSDNRVEIFRKILDQASGQLLGYQAQTLGSYSLTGDSLQISHTDCYVIDASSNFARGYYSSLTGLIPIGQQRELNLIISFNLAKTKVTFHYLHCPPHTDCIDYQVFQLEKKYPS